MSTANSRATTGKCAERYLLQYEGKECAQMLSLNALKVNDKEERRGGNERGKDLEKIVRGKGAISNKRSTLEDTIANVSVAKNRSSKYVKEKQLQD